ncbi:MAG: rhomboid family intramembrane serine protease [Verrucomicrobia bacterium]|nr:rhomboid family intramembrane serine protease [Verrucomicrobiota bacterium]
MDSATARIPVRSHRQAMDWSLVLVSQGIESTIEEPAEGTGWGMVVASPDYTNALRTLRQYRLENRGWPWQQAVFKQGFLFDWGSLAWALLACLFFWLSAHTSLQSAGLMDSTAVAHGQWWRLFTAMWLHADLAHLATNATLGLVLLGLTMGRYGTGVGLLAAYLAGAGGNLVAGLITMQPHHSLGASGMVMGSLGLLAVQSFSLWRQTPHALKYILSGICGGIMLFVLFALTPGTDVMAHLGGFASGLILGALLSLVPEVAHRPRTNLLCGFLFAIMVILPWWLALWSSGS